MNKLMPKLRWIIMITSFVLLVYGGRFLSINTTYLPVFNCPYNLDAVVEGSCLYITNFRDYISGEMSGSALNLLKIYGITIGLILMFGKLWCGYICPFGFIQELVYKLRGFLGIKPLTLTQKHKDVIKIVKYAVLLIFVVGLGFCDICPVRFVLPPLNGVATGLEVGLIVAVITMVAALFSERFFCRICPMGAIMGILNKFSPWKIKKDCISCTECGICYEVCPMDIREIYTEREKEDVTDVDCIFCNKCIDNCPEKEALSLSCLGKKVYKSSRKKYYKNNV